MQRFFYRLLLRLCSFCFLLFITNQVLAIDERYAADVLRGGQLVTNGGSTVEDAVYFNPQLKPLQTTSLVKNLITFQIDEQYRGILPDTFDVSLRYTVTYTYDNNGTQTTVTSDPFTLKIAYSKNNKYSFKAVNVQDGWYKAIIKIIDVTPGNGSNLNAFQDALMLTNEILVNREYSFSCTNNAVQAISADIATVPLKGELKVYWNTERAADEYDLEWSYIDDSALANYYISGSTTDFDAKKIFTRNATRVSIQKEAYYIPLLYEASGHLFYRVRAVQVKVNGQRLESVWSSDYAGGMGNYVYAGLDDSLNWQASTNFAEEGKRKSVVQYYDGSLKTRQTVTKDNTSDTTIIAETFYDYQGQPVIQVLPTPSLNNIIKYSPRFNGLNGAEYTKDAYDGMLIDSCFCKQGAPTMDNTSGAAQYYSPNNPLVNTGYHRYIPNANGYVFAETRYVPDNSGRVSLQGGVGDQFQIGKGHETKYTYNSADQEELDALFGTEVGNAAHYFKNTVRDANGQVNISYVDMHGRTIATALAGFPAEKLDAVPSNKGYVITKNLIDSNTNIIKGRVIESTKGLFVTKAGPHQFKYSLLPDTISINACDNKAICYDCVYDLQITITDDCNNSTLPNGKPIVFTKSNYRINADTLCNGNSFQGVDETVFLREGSYQVTKTLTINKQAMDSYRDIFLKRNTCRSLERTVQEQKQLIQQTMACAPGETVKQSLYASIMEQMRADVTPPFGQYANPDNVDQYSIFSRHQFRLTYTRVTDYKDENGNPDPLNPRSLSIPDFVKEFKSSWAVSLVPYHPEFPKLVRLNTLAASNAWDERFGGVQTWQAAVDSGFLNPGNFATHPAASAFAFNFDHRDPFFTDLVDQGYVNANYKIRMQDSLVRIAEDANGAAVSMWSLATIMAHCSKDDLSCFDQFKDINAAFTIGADCSGDLDIAWRTFRDLYLQKKQEMIADILRIAQNLNSEFFRDLADLHNNHAPNFVDPTLVPTSNLTTDTTLAKAGLENYINDNCAAYANQWWNELQPSCKYSSADSAAIIPLLIQVCREGGDADHVYGASTVKPSSTNTYRSFEEVLKAYNQNAGIPYNSSCNVYLISAPKPYDQQPVYYEKPLLQKPTDCECATINEQYQQYQLAGKDASFSAYLLRTSGTVMRTGTLDTLRMACNGQVVCSFLKEPIKLPPALQCGVKDVCVNCASIDSLYQKFTTQFPDAVPRLDNTDSLQREKNKLFEQFMNSQLGFSKATAEYLEFIDSCGIKKENDTACNIALQFNGAARQRVVIPAGNNIQRLEIGFSNFTIEAKVKLKSIPDNAHYTIISSVAGANGPGGTKRPLDLYIDPNGDITFALAPCVFWKATGNDLFDNKAHSIAVTRDGDSLAIFVDGVNRPVVGQSKCGSGPSAISTRPSAANFSGAGGCRIGHDSVYVVGGGPSAITMPYGYFNGWMKYVRIWKKARTEGELAADADKDLAPQDGLVGNYIMQSNDTCQQFVIDQSTDDTALRNNGIFGEVAGKEQVDPSWLSGAQVNDNGIDPVGVANTCSCEKAAPEAVTCNTVLGFTASSGQRVTIPYQNNRLDLGFNNLTIEAKIKLKSTGGSGGYTVFSNGKVALTVAGTGVTFNVGQCSSYYTSGANLFDGKAHHVAVSWNATGSGSLYIDGVAQTYGTILCSGGNPLPATGNSYIGFNPVTGANLFNGWMSYVRVWNKPRTAAEITSNIDSMALLPQDGLVGNYIMTSDNACQQFVIDQSSNNLALRNNGIFGNSIDNEAIDPVWLSSNQISYNSPDPVNAPNTCTCESVLFAADTNCNKALQFSRTGNQRVLIPNPNERLKLGTGNFTMEAMIKPKQIPGVTTYTILSNRGKPKAGVGRTVEGFELSIMESSYLALTIEGCGLAYVYAPQLFDGKAHHVAVSRNVDTFSIHIDGVSKYKTTGSGCSIDSNGQQYQLKPSQLNLSGPGNLCIGYDSLPNLWNQGFNGWMSYVRLWNKARTTADIAGSMNKLLLPQNGLVGNYILGSNNTCQQYVIDQSTSDPALRNNGILGHYTGSESIDPVWLSEAQISYGGNDPVNTSNTCACGGAAGNELQDSKNEFINYYYNYGRKYDSYGIDTSTWKVNWAGFNINNTGIAHKDIFKNGTAQFPDILSSSYGHQAVNFDFFAKDSADVNGYVNIEIGMKDEIMPGEWEHGKSLKFYFSNPAGTEELGVTLGQYMLIMSQIYNTYGGQTSMGFANEFSQTYTGSHKFNFEIKDFVFNYYVDGQLIKSFNFPPSSQFYSRKTFYGLSLNPRVENSLSAQFEYIKCTDRSGRVFYNESFDDNTQFRLFDRYIESPRLPCTRAFANWYNTRKGTNYTYSQLDSIYAASHMALDICTEPLVVKPGNKFDPKLTLCGKTEPVFAPADEEFTQHTPCADSTLFAWSTSVLIHEAYSDSLLGNFDDRYLARCLNARYHETFTVEQPISEFHYTLYYYDQAGNLIKTIAPEGVDISKFAWASAWSDSVKAARKANQLLTPKHMLPTQYRYNTLNQVVAQQSPDGGLSEFWLDRLGRIAISRNARQRRASANEDNRLYSYTKYDALGRITEVGQVSNTAVNEAMTDAVSRNESMLNNWLTKLSGRRGQITNTVYDLPYAGFTGITDITDPRMVLTQRNLRNRVSFTTLTDTGTNTAYNQGTFYTYDILGNVDTLLQDFGNSDIAGIANVMNKNGNRWKKITYKYDLISGKVNMVMYQRGWRDGFYHRYSYDSENRLTLVETSTDSLVWEKEARYDYYRHGPLARVAIGDQQVQGTDYAYTLQGWLKGINATAPAEQGTGAGDIGSDAKIGSLNQYTANDAIGLTLNYFTGDYTAINSGVMPFPGYSGHILPSNAYRPLFNGNISSQSVYQKRFENGNTPGGPLIFYNYKYDQLNRLIAQDAYKGFNNGFNNWEGMTSMGENLKERIAYDGNGNILKYLRNSISGTTGEMDSLNYYYYANTNQLKRITDKVAVTAFPGSHDNPSLADIENQADNNYGYDSIGNLIWDNAEGITDIKWTVYGKIQEITKAATATAPATNIKYIYDAEGNRISQVVTSSGREYYTWYVRDAQGNLLSTYTAEGNNSDLAALNLIQADRYLYGSNRLGVLTTGESMDGGPVDIQLTHSYDYSRGAKQYELTNHLGNVLATVSDRKFGVTSAGSSLIDHYEPHIVTAQDYYPFGMLSRVALPGNDKSYAFGFNGKMNDNDVKGLGNQQDYGLRIYDPRIGKFLSVDPLTKGYPELTPYQFASNRPIDGVDLDGGEWKIATDWLADKAKANGYPTLSGIIRGLGGLDIQSQTQQLTDNAMKGNFRAVAKQLYGYSLKAQVDNLEATTKRAINENDPEAYGELYTFIGIGALGDVGMGEPPTGGLFKFSEHPVANTNRLAIEAHGNFQAAEGNAANTITNRVYITGENTGTGSATDLNSKATDEWNGPIDYSNLKEPRNVGPYLETTRSQRARILEYNKKQNGGVIRSDADGSILDQPTQNITKGQKANMNQAEVDHIQERIKGGSNSNKNQRVISKQQNVDKEANRKSKKT